MLGSSQRGLLRKTESKELRCMYSVYTWIYSKAIDPRGGGGMEYQRRISENSRERDMRIAGEFVGL